MSLQDKVLSEILSFLRQVKKTLPVLAKLVEEIEEVIIKSTANTQLNETQNPNQTNSVINSGTEVQPHPISGSNSRRGTQNQRLNFLIINFIVVKLLPVLIVVSSCLYLIFIFPSIMSWTWLLQHPRKLGLQMSGVLILFGIVWVILDKDKDRRAFAFGSIIVATLLGVIQLI